MYGCDGKDDKTVMEKVIRSAIPPEICLPGGGRQKCSPSAPATFISLYSTESRQ